MKLLIAILFSLAISQVLGHGRLINPASRSSLWRFEEYSMFNPPVNLQDNELFCGGFPVQTANGGKCGECGDPYHLPRPRENEGGGKYGRGVLARTYNVGQVIPVTVDLTANHKGWFEYRLCPQNNPLVPVQQECLDRHVLLLAGTTETKQSITGEWTGKITVNLQLPKDVTCRHCVLQWHYWTGNSWGECDDGTSAIGCGPQETFRGCADVAIVDL